MLEKMRKQAKFFIYFIAIAFILTIVLNWGMNVLGLKSKNAGSNIVGKINKEKITYQQLQKAIQKAYADYKNQNQDKEITDKDMEKIREQAWNDLINNYIMYDQIKDYNIEVSDNEIAQFIKFAPPAEVKNEPSFQTDGKFDYQKYAAFIKSPQSSNFIRQMEYLYRATLPNDKLIYRLFSTINITDFELQKFYHLKNDKAKIEFISYKTNIIPDNKVSIDSNAVKQYYNENKEKYKEPEALNISVVFIKKEPTKEDLKNAVVKINKIYQRLQKGENFAELAKNLSEDKRSASNGGKIGYLEKNTIKMEQYAKTAFSLKKGEFSAPFKVQNRWYIVKVNDVRKNKKGNEEREISQIIVFEKPSNATLDSLRNLALDLIKNTHRKGFKKALEMHNLTAKNFNKIKRTSFLLPEYGYIADLPKFLQTCEKGQITNKVYENNEGYYVIYVNDVIPSYVKPLEKVYNLIENNLKQDKKMELLKIKMDSLAKLAKNVKNLQDIDKNAKIQTSNLFSRVDFVPGIGKANEVIAAAFVVDTNKISGPFKGDNSYYFIKVIQREIASDADLIKNKEKEQNELTMYMRNIVYQKWYEYIRKQYDIKDFRSKFFY